MSRTCLLLPVSFNNSKTLKHLGLVVWGKPPKALEIFQSGSSFFAENWIGSLMILSRVCKRKGRAAIRTTRIKYQIKGIVF